MNDQNVREFLAATGALLMAEAEADNDLFLDDSSSGSDEDEIDEILLHYTKIPRISVQGYFEEVVPAYSDEEFIRHFRISRGLFVHLSNKYENTDEFQKMFRQNPARTVLPNKTLAVFLWFAAHESCSYRDISDRFNISLSTVHEIILRGTAFITNLSPEVIRWPTVAEMNEEAMFREAESRIPGIIGLFR